MTAGLIAGRFHLRRLLGSGGTASVFEADDVRTGRTVALKLLHAHLASGPEVSGAFFEEVRAVSAIAHPNLAQIYDAGVDGDDLPIVWIAMELVPGVSLADHVREHGRLEIEHAVVIGRAVLDALTAVHAAGVVHRDVTPANIMFDPSRGERGAASDVFARSVRLLDFGLADIPGRTTRGGDLLLSVPPSHADGVVASVPYASPEQLSGQAVGEQSDLYQLGVSLYVGLTGQVPFSGGAEAVARAHLSAPPPVVSARRRDAPRALDRVIATAMLKRPADRYPDAAAMRRALDDVLRDGVYPGPAADPDTDTDTDSSTALTRVYRTTVTGDAGSVGRTERDIGGPIAASTAATSPSGWRAPVIVALIIAVTTAVAGWSAMAASRTPEPTQRAAPATSVTPESPSATPSAAVEVVHVPDVSALALPEATRVLERAGLVVGDVVREDGPEAADTVRATIPRAGESLRPGATVEVHAASGLNAVPRAVGLPIAEAQALLVAAGFASRSENGTSGIVAETTPAAGEVTPVGTVVTLRGSTADPGTPAPTASPTATPTPTMTPTLAPTPVPTDTEAP